MTMKNSYAVAAIENAAAIIYEAIAAAEATIVLTDMNVDAPTWGAIVAATYHHIDEVTLDAVRTATHVALRKATSSEWVDISRE